LHDLREFVPQTFYAEAVPKIAQGKADWLLGKMLAKKNPSMTSVRF
jgi:hypothetical protein